MKKLILAFALAFALVGCSSLQNPFTGSSSNYALLQALCSSPYVATNPQFQLACIAGGLIPQPAPAPAPK
jgi:uncharacterized protein YcfL